MSGVLLVKIVKVFFKDMISFLPTFEHQSWCLIVRLAQPHMLHSLNRQRRLHREYEDCKLRAELKA